MRTAGYLDAAKAKLGVDSDYALAKHLKVGTTRISNWRAGRNLPDVAMAVRLAQLVGEDAIKVIADIEEERNARNSEKRKFWRSVRDGAVIGLVAMTAYGLGAVDLTKRKAPEFMKATCSWAAVSKVFGFAFGLVGVAALAQALGLVDLTFAELVGAYAPVVWAQVNQTTHWAIIAAAIALGLVALAAARRSR